MSKILRITFRGKVTAAIYAFIFLLIISSVTAAAQCRLAPKTKGKANFVETLEDYQYIRTVNLYCGMAIKTAMLTTAQGQAYSLTVRYTGTATVATPGKISFKFKDDSVIVVKPILLALKKTDNIQLVNKVFRVHLKSTDVASFKQKQLKEIDVLFDKKDTFVTIPVDEPTFMQSQVTCLQASLQ